MPQQFDWQTEEDLDWEALPPVGEVRKPKRTFSPRLLLSLLGFVILILLAGAWQFNRIVQTGIENAESDVANSFLLYNRAAVERDRELVTTLISGANSKWSFTHLEMVTADMVYNRAPFSLYLQAVPSQVVEVTLDETLTAAELISEQAYTFIAADGTETPVRLRHTTLLRKGTARWLVANPRYDYWGRWQTAEGDFISLSYREKEAEIAERLLPDLETAVAILCDDPAYPCPREDRIQIRFDDDLQSLLVTSEPTRMMLPQRTFNLPTPTLVGIPIDEPSYEALVTGYAAFIVGHYLLDEAEWSCCERGLFQQALLDWQLAELGLRPWPLRAEHYQQLVRDGLEGPDLEAYWDTTPKPLWGNAQRQVYAFTAFLFSEERAVGPFLAQQRLQRADDYRYWMQSIAQRFPLNDQFRRQYLQFVRLNMPIIPDEEAALPQDIQLICKPGRGQLADLVRYRAAENVWTPETINRELVFLSGWADDQGVYFVEQDLAGREFHAYSLDAGEKTHLFSQPLTKSLFRIDNTRDNLLLYSFDFPQKQTTHDLFALTECRGELCAPLPLGRGLPVWSPDGVEVLLAAEDGLLYRGGAEVSAVSPIAAGQLPFWFVDGQFGFLTGAGGEQRVMLSANEELLLLRELSDYLALLPPVQRAGEAQIRGLSADPAGGGRFFVAVELLIGDTARTYLFRDAVGDAEPRLIWGQDGNFGAYNPFSYSPDGRWLTVQNYTAGHRWQLNLYDVQSGAQLRYRSTHPISLPGFDWSADGRWLLIIDDGYLQVVDPGSGAAQLLVHEYSSCNFAVWVW